MEAWQNREVIALWICIAFLALSILVIAFLLLMRKHFSRLAREQQTRSDLELKHQKELLTRSSDIQEEERKRIANDLHDDVIGKLNAILTIHQFPNREHEINQLLSKTIDTVRYISHDLSPPLLETMTLEELMEDQLTAFREDERFTVLFTKDNHTQYSASPRIKLHVLRLFQESLTNVRKHANATNIEVHLQNTPQSITIQIEDNGVGFRPAETNSGLGLSSIRTRTQLINGKLEIISSPGNGTKITLFIPINSDHDNN